MFKVKSKIASHRLWKCVRW